MNTSNTTNSPDTINSVAILGGGAAGWLTAGRLAAAFPHLNITLIESPNQPILGVGEGTWPSMRETLRKIGINELAFMQQCDASFKQGSWFTAWEHENDTLGYCHPFTTPLGYQSANMHEVWRSVETFHKQQMPANDAAISYGAAVSVQTHICKQNQAPKQKSTPEYAGVLSYGYHLDANKFASMLAKHCIEKLSVIHVLSEVSSITTTDSQHGYSHDIAGLVTKSKVTITADLFIDCSGMGAKLIGEHYEIGTHNVSDILVNNSAVAAHVPYQPNEQVQACTHATAKENGWIWDIGLSSRRGVGMVFSSVYNTHESAKQTLLDYIKSTSPETDLSTISVRNLSFTPAYRKQFWHHNCLAIGMSAGFVEPLEASALAMVELSINMLVDEFPQNREHMELSAKRFNERFSYRWERAVDFIHLHYLCSKRKDSDYWRRMSDKSYASERLQELLTLWQYQPPSRHDLIQNEEIFPSASYQFILYGMHFMTATRPVTNQDDILQSQQLKQRLHKRIYTENQQKLKQLEQGLPSTSDLLIHINSLANQH